MTTPVAPTKQNEKRIEAEQRAAHWMAEANAAEEAGKYEKSAKCWFKAQYWLDRLNKIEGYMDMGQHIEAPVQNLTAAVEVYETPADYLEADAFQSHAYEEAAARLDVELAEPLEVIQPGDYVHVTPHYMQRPYFAWVEAVNYETGRIVVSHWSFSYVNEYSFEEVRLVLKRNVAELEAETPETAEATTSVS